MNRNVSLSLLMLVLGVVAWLGVPARVHAAAPAPAAGATAATQPMAESLAELPLWPVGLRVPDELAGRRPKKGPVPADIMVWTPPIKTLRALLLVPNNTDSKEFLEHPAVREVLTKQGVGIIYMRSTNPGIEHTETPDLTKMPAILDFVATSLDRPEVRNAPWITFGKSSRGEFPFRAAWLFPTKVIATIAYHAETPSWPVRAWADFDALKAQSILNVDANGENEWAYTWFRHVRPSLLNYRANTKWLPHQIVVFGVGHGNYPDASGSPGWDKPVGPRQKSCRDTWNYLAMFIDKAMDLRVPKDASALDGPITLNQVDPDKGYLIHPRAVEVALGLKWRPLRQEEGRYSIIDHIKEPGEVYDPNPGTLDPAMLIRKATDVPEAERKNYFWLADKEQADAWLKFHTIPPAPDTEPAEVQAQRQAGD